MNRGEIWLANFDKTIGDEIRKTRPVVIVSSDSLKQLSLKTVVPISTWKPHLSSLIWIIKIIPSATNGLRNESATLTSQVQTISKERFVRKMGKISNGKLKEIVAAVAMCIEYE